MKLVLILTLMAVSSCAADGGSGGDDDDTDASPAHGIHDQVTTCDARWTVDGVAPTVCEFACRIRPEHPTGIPRKCTDASRPCYTGADCQGASSPSDVARICDETFVLADGTSGCCAQRVLEQQPARYIPTFYQCPLSP